MTRQAVMDQAWLAKVWQGHLSWHHSCRATTAPLRYCGLMYVHASSNTQ